MDTRTTLPEALVEEAIKAYEELPESVRAVLTYWIRHTLVPASTLHEADRYWYENALNSARPRGQTPYVSQFQYNAAILALGFTPGPAVRSLENLRHPCRYYARALKPDRRRLDVDMWPPKQAYRLSPEEQQTLRVLSEKVPHEDSMKVLKLSHRLP